MFPNGYNINMPFYSPYGSMGPVLRNTFGMQIPQTLGTATRSGGLLSRLTGLGGLRSFNWQGLLTNTSKTLNVINQAIPIVKQVGPMYNNMKSMLRIASLFKDETDPTSNKETQKKEESKTNNTTDNETKENTITTNSYSNTPNFFI